jgi:hypothetical protein
VGLNLILPSFDDYFVRGLAMVIISVLKRLSTEARHANEFSSGQMNLRHLQKKYPVSSFLLLY